MFAIRRATLSDECRDSIEALFTKKKIKADVPALLDKVNLFLSIFKSLAREPINKQGEAALRKRALRETQALMRALKGLSPYAREILHSTYLLANHIPPPDGYIASESHLIERVLNQSERTHFIRKDERGRSGLPVPFRELAARILRTCELADLCNQRCDAPRRGAPRNTDRILFTEYIMTAYEEFTAKKASSAPNAPFDTFLSYILSDVTDEPELETLRKLIIAADTGRRRKCPRVFPGKENALWSELSKTLCEGDTPCRLNLYPATSPEQYDQLLLLMKDAECND